MNYEQLPPNLIIPQLEKRLLELKETLKKLNDINLKRNSDNCTLRIAQKKGHPDYYYVNKSTSSQGVYIPKKKRAFAQQTKNSAVSKIHALYTKMCSARKRLITPLTLTPDQYAARWKNVSWQGLPFAPDAAVYTTNQGERVRSKSEVLIANALAQHNIPYRYEYSLTLSRGLPQNTTNTAPSS